MTTEADPFEQYADDLVGRAVRAAEAFRLLDQDRTDRVVAAAFEAAFAARCDLARMAFEETQMGIYEHKVLKNAWASFLTYEEMRGRGTVGVLSEDVESGITEIAAPKGPILALTPVTNPTSTTIMNALICLKTRNPVIFSGHRGAKKCSKEAARILAEAAVAAGAPPDSIQWITKAQSEYLDRVMRHRDLALILATGTPGIVKVAQASGTPTLGAGPGNVPVYVHESADLELAAKAILRSKTFDNGVICASEQALIVTPAVDRRFRKLLEARGAYFCSVGETDSLGPVCFDAEKRGMRAEVVGKPARAIAELAGFRVPEGVRLLVAEPRGIGRDHPLSHEILAPVLAYYLVLDHDAALAACAAILRLGGVGHTLGVYTQEERIVGDFFRMNAGRILVNTGTTEGAVGGIYNRLRFSLTLSCGAGAKNAVLDNITTHHLLDIHRVAQPRPNRAWLDVPEERWLDPGLRTEEIIPQSTREGGTASVRALPRDSQ